MKDGNGELDFGNGTDYKGYILFQRKKNKFMENLMMILWQFLWRIIKNLLGLLKKKRFVLLILIIRIQCIIIQLQSMLMNKIVVNFIIKYY